MTNKDDVMTEGTDMRSRGTSAAFPHGLLPAMVSYAQNFEDVMLRRALFDIETGFYVDIGAHDPTQDSVTRWFYDCGWRGIDVEPSPNFFEALARERPGDIVLDCAIGSASGTTKLRVFGETGLSTIMDTAAVAANDHGYAVTAEIEVAMLSLDDLLQKYSGDRTIDFLKIDVEGAEADILRSASFQVNRPRIIVVEATRPLTTDTAQDEWEPHILSQDYDFAWFDGLNRFYVRREDRERLAAFTAPPCVFDHFVPRGTKEAEARLGEATAHLQQKQDWIDEHARRLKVAQARIAELELWYEELSSRTDALANGT